MISICIIKSIDLLRQTVKNLVESVVLKLNQPAAICFLHQSKLNWTSFPTNFCCWPANIQNIQLYTKFSSWNFAGEPGKCHQPDRGCIADWNPSATNSTTGTYGRRAKNDSRDSERIIDQSSGRYEVTEGPAFSDCSRIKACPTACRKEPHRECNIT